MQQLAQVTAERDLARERLRERDREAAAIRAGIATLEQTLDELDAQNQRLKEENAELTTSVADRGLQIQQLTQRIAALEVQAAQSSSLAERVQSEARLCEDKHRDHIEELKQELTFYSRESRDNQSLVQENLELKRQGARTARQAEQLEARHRSAVEQLEARHRSALADAQQALQAADAARAREGSNAAAARTRCDAAVAAVNMALCGLESAARVDDSTGDPGPVVQLALAEWNRRRSALADDCQAAQRSRDALQDQLDRLQQRRADQALGSENENARLRSSLDVAQSQAHESLEAVKRISLERANDATRYSQQIAELRSQLAHAESQLHEAQQRKRLERVRQDVDYANRTAETRADLEMALAEIRGERDTLQRKCALLHDMLASGAARPAPQTPDALAPTTPKHAASSKWVMLNSGGPPTTGRRRRQLYVDWA